MVKRLVIHQPNFLPRLKILQKIAKADLWVILNDVQYAQREWQNRSVLRYLNEANRTFWLSIPVYKPTGRNSLIQSIRICNYNHSKNQIYKTIYYTYRSSKYWNWIDNYLSEIFTTPTDSLAHFSTRTTLACFSLLGIPKPTIWSSSFNTTGTKTTKLINICKTLGTKIYISGSGGRSYLNENEFKKTGIRIEWQLWSNPNLVNNKDFPDYRNISFIDLVARNGPNALKHQLLKQKNVKYQLI